MKQKLSTFLVIISFSMIWTSCKKTYLDAPKTVDKQEFLDLVNDVRQSGCNCGGENMPSVAPIVWNDILSTVAQTHAMT
jgi:uncharacterized protein YkwD